MTAIQTPSSTQSVRQSIEVEAPQAHAFAVFTEGQTTWWPLDSHHIGKSPAQAAVVEPRAGGRWYERGVDGSECNWGRVVAWEPPHRLVLAWEISADWQPDPTVSTTLEVRFVAAGPRTTRVELEHRDLDRFGDRAEQMRSTFDSGWAGLLQSFAAAAGKREPLAASTAPVM
jgi:uncharacterized protein YndB with AHSA1/START domain